MIKRFFIFILSLALLVSTAFAEVDISSMTDLELKSLADTISSELRSRNFSQDENGIEIISEGGFRIYQVGDAYLSSSGRLKVPVLVYNDLDVSASFSFVNASCNDFVVQGYCYTTFPPKTKAFEELDFSSEDAGLSDVKDIFSLRFSWRIYCPDTRSYAYEHTEIEEFRFW